MSGECDKELVEIAACGGVVATDDVRGRVVMLGFHQKGVAVLLTYDEALALGRVLRRLAQGIDKSESISQK